jgi:hypothetical protein
MNVLNWILDNAVALAIGVISSVLGAIFYQPMLARMPSIARGHSTVIGGFWLGRVPYKETPERIGYNLYRISEINGHVKFYGEHVDSFRGNTRITFGQGIFRAPTFSAFYYFADDNCHETGVLTFILGSTENGEHLLSGCFAQVRDRAKKEIHRDDYVIVKVNIPIRRRLNRFTRRRYFYDFKDANDFVNSLSNDIKRNLTLHQKPADNIINL